MAKINNSEMVKRIVTGAVLTICFLVVLHFSYISNLIRYICSILCLISEFEIIRTIESNLYRNCAFLVAAIYTPVVMISNLTYYIEIIILLFPVYVFAVVILFMYFSWFKKKGIAFRPLIIVMLPLLFYSFVEFSKYPDGNYYIIGVVCVSCLTDISAYFVGRKYGTSKLAPQISPNKTIIGSIGGTVITLIICFIIIKILVKPSSLVSKFAWCIYICLASIIAQMGDLEMSAVKRIAGIKDFGNILPGHGGILDRFDSVLMVAPFSILCLHYLDNKLIF